jgi:hypothetical protein
MMNLAQGLFHRSWQGHHIAICHPGTLFERPVEPTVFRSAFLMLKPFRNHPNDLTCHVANLTEGAPP